MESKKPSSRRFDGPTRRVVRGPKATSPAKPTVIPVTELAPEKSAAESVVASKEIAPEAVESTAAPMRKQRWAWSHKKTAALMITLVLGGVVGAVGLKAVMASQKIVTKNVSGPAPALQEEAIDPTKLKGEGDGRINILLLGVGGDGHDGGGLSDTIMVTSIDPINKTVAMLSLPRDLYVRIPGHGYSKINAANSLGGPELAKETVSDILDLPIHYYAQVDFTGFKQAIDAVGGVKVTNKINLYDPEYPCELRGYCPFALPAGEYQMSGNLALKYARCRHGACGSDFGRAERQQELMAALRAKTAEASTLTNPVKVSGLIDSVGDHVRTDMQLNEMQKMAKIIKEIDISKAANEVLDDKADGLLVGGGNKYPGAGAILLPRAGDFNYTAIRQLAHSIFADGYLKKENATVQVQNGTLKTGMGASVTQMLKNYNYNVVATVTAPTQDYAKTVIYDRSGGKKPYTVKYLEQRFNTKAQVQAATPVAGQTSPDIDIIVGNDYNLSAATTASSGGVLPSTTTTTTR